MNKNCPHCKEKDTVEPSINKIIYTCRNCGEVIPISKTNEKN